MHSSVMKLLCINTFQWWNNIKQFARLSAALTFLFCCWKWWWGSIFDSLGFILSFNIEVESYTIIKGIIFLFTARLFTSFCGSRDLNLCWGDTAEKIGDNLLEHGTYITSCLCRDFTEQGFVVFGELLTFLQGNFSIKIVRDCYSYFSVYLLASRSDLQPAIARRTSSSRWDLTSFIQLCKLLKVSLPFAGLEFICLF